MNEDGNNKNKSGGFVQGATDAIVEAKKKKIIRNVIFSVLGCSPFAILMVLVIFVVVLFVLGVFTADNSSSDKNIVFDSTCNYENTMVTVMDGSNTKVLATISLEDYLIGVACPEIGACNGYVSSMPEHYIKIKFVAAKTYVLSRNGYSSSDKSITIRASTRDQQWCDLKEGCIVSGSDSEGFLNTYPGNYSDSQVAGGVSQRYYYTDEDLELLHKYYKETYGDLYLPTSFQSTITSLDSSTATEYKSDTQLWWRDEASSGKNYEEILNATGTSGHSDAEDYVGKKLYKLADYCKSTGGTVSTPGDIKDAVYLDGGLPIPIYYQDDYGDVQLAPPPGNSVATSGCGFTSSAMVVSYLLGQKITPREFVDDWSRAYYVPAGMDWELPNAAAKHYNLGTVERTVDVNVMINALKNNQPVMSSQGPGLFTSEGHLIVIRGMTSDGKFLVNDPNSANSVGRGYNDRAFTREEIEASNAQYFIWPKKSG